MKKDKNLHVISHPLVQYKLTHMRDKNTPSNVFRVLMHEVAMLMGYEVLSDLETSDIEIETPHEKMKSPALSGKKMCIVSILRSGNGFLDALLNLVPLARVGHIGLYRDPDRLIPVEYYLKMPDDLHERQVLIVDPMLATGKSAIAAIDRVKSMDAAQVKFLCLVASPEGIEAVREEYPDLPIYTACVDREIDESGFILPGIGDAGDRIYGTK